MSSARITAGRCEGLLILSGAKGASVSMVDPGSTQCHFEAPPPTR